MSNIKRYLLWPFIAFIILFVAGEMVARYGMGLGDPPLYVTHSTIEYMLKPDQDVYRFGNHYIVNHYGMRSAPFGLKKKDNEIRILLFGDSVINGGSLTDHTELAATILEKRLNEKYGGKIVVGNISAGSWGPGNWLAYSKDYGFFEADVIMLVISSHDYRDNPTFKLLDFHHPTKKPVSALLEGLSRYLLPRFLHSSNVSNRQQKHQLSESEEKKIGLNDLRQFLSMAKSYSENVIVFQHWDRSETANNKVKLGNKLIREVCQSMEIPAIQLGPSFSRAMEQDIHPYRDGIHPNAFGQELIFESIDKNLPSLSQLK